MIFVILFLSIFSGIFYFYLTSSKKPKLQFPENGYFNSGPAKPDDETIRPFKVDVSDEILQDLKDRLRKSRIGHEQLEDVNDFSFGFNLKTLEDFKNYWLEKYDWRKVEAELNSLPQFVTEIEGLRIHFVHAKPPEKKYSKVVPLLLAHGWPGNVYEFYKIIPILTDPASFLSGKHDLAFEVVAPSMPGYGWSEAAKKKGMNVVVMGRMFKKLMNRLGKGKFVAQGGDWGSAVVSSIAKLYPESVYGVHLNMFWTIFRFSPKALFYNIFGTFFPSLVFEDKNRFKNFSYFGNMKNFIAESGYLHLQATKPDTVGVSLNDSPVGLMAYILEKFSTWTNPAFKDLPDGGLEKKFTKDELLTIVMIYWVNGNILPSQRLYKENFSAEASAVGNEFISVPLGYAAFPGDLAPPVPKELVKLSANLTHLTYFDDGGHFAAFEMPKQLASDVFAFTQKLRID